MNARAGEFGAEERMSLVWRNTQPFVSFLHALQEHYGELKEKPFYGKLVDYIISGPVVCIV